MRRGSVALAAGLLLVLLAPDPGGARQAGQMSVSEDDPRDQQDFAPIPASNSSVLLHRPSDCRTAGYCDVIDLHIEIPERFDFNDEYRVQVTLEWDEPDLNDLDLFVYDEREVRQAESASADYPEQTELNEPESGLYYVVVNNWAGPNLGYRLTAEYEHLGRRPGLPQLRRPGGRAPGGPPDSAPARRPSAPTSSGRTAGPAPTPVGVLSPDRPTEPPATPGTDGPRVEMPLTAVAAGIERDGVGERSGTSRWLVAVPLALLAAGVGGLMFVRLRRARAG